MGAIWLTGGQLVAGLTELVGYKLGLDVTEAELRTAFGRADVADAFPHDLGGMLRIRSETYEELTRIVLQAFGDADAASTERPPVMSVLSRIKDPDQATAFAVIDFVLARMGPLIESTPVGRRMDPRPILDSVRAEWGDEGMVIATMLLAEMNARTLASPWSVARRREWEDLAPLHDLFVPEETTATLGTFFDGGPGPPARVTVSLRSVAVNPPGFVACSASSSRRLSTS